MRVNLEYIKDVFSYNYLGVRVQREAALPFLEQMRGHLGDRFEAYAAMQSRRDMGGHHINVMTSSECRSLADRIGLDRFTGSIQSFLEMEYDVTMLGLGQASARGNTEYFVVVKSDGLAAVRKKYDLPEKDFTVCLGFYPGEVFGVRKNTLVPLTDPFLKLLGAEYYNNNKSFEFLKNMTNFDGDPAAEVEPVSISDTLATFRCGQTSYMTVSLLGDALGISARWQGDNDRPRMSDTLVARKLKNT